MHSYELRTCLFFFTCNLLKSWSYLNRSELYNCDWFELATFDSYYWIFGRNTDCRITEYDNDFSALEICNLNYDKLSHDFSVEAYNCSRLRSNDVMSGYIQKFGTLCGAEARDVRLTRQKLSFRLENAMLF